LRVSGSRFLVSFVTSSSNQSCANTVASCCHKAVCNRRNWNDNFQEDAHSGSWVPWIELLSAKCAVFYSDGRRRFAELLCPDHGMVLHLNRITCKHLLAELNFLKCGRWNTSDIIFLAPCWYVAVPAVKDGQPRYAGYSVLDKASCKCE